MEKMERTCQSRDQIFFEKEVFNEVFRKHISELIEQHEQ